MVHFRRFYFASTGLEVVSDVISCVDIEQVSRDIPVKFGVSRLNGSRDIRLPHFVTDGRTDEQTNDERPRRRPMDPTVVSPSIGLI